MNFLMRAAVTITINIQIRGNGSLFLDLHAQRTISRQEHYEAFTGKQVGNGEADKQLVLDNFVLECFAYTRTKSLSFYTPLVKNLTMQSKCGIIIIIAEFYADARIFNNC